MPPGGLVTILGALAVVSLLAGCASPSSAPSSVKSPAPSQTGTTPVPSTAADSRSAQSGGQSSNRPAATPTKAPFLQTLGAYGSRTGEGVTHVPRGGTCTAKVTVAQGGSSTTITPAPPPAAPDPDVKDYPAIQYFFSIPDQPPQASVIWSFHCMLRDAQEPRYVVWEASKTVTYAAASSASASPSRPSPS